MECERPALKDGECILVVSGPNAKELVAVRVFDSHGPVPGISVAISVEPALAIAASVTSGPDGVAAAEYIQAGAVTPHVITFRARVAGIDLAKVVKVTPLAKSIKETFALDTLINDGAAWYVERQIPRRLGVVISNAKSKADCDSAIVKFKAFGEAVGSAPDSAFGEWLPADDKKPHCVAQARWKLGKETGEQLLRAELSGDPAKQTVFHATARGLPRLMAGLVLTPIHRYDIVASTDRAVRLTRTVKANADTSTDFAFDTTFSGKPSLTTSEKYHFAPILGVDWAPWLPWGNVRVMVGTNPNNAQNEWVLGVSILQAAFGQQRETVPVDLQIAFDFLRRNRVVNTTGCVSNVTACKMELDNLKVVGVGIMLSVDGTALLKDLVTAFPLK